MAKKDYKLNRFPDSFKCVFELWFDIICEYTKIEKEDAIQYYNERANVGAFCAALARNNITYLEEYVCEKGWGDNKGNGRTDLSFYFRGQWYVVEAKICKGKGTWLSKFKSSIDAACDDVHRTWQKQRYSASIGMSFVVPEITNK
ncbi:MAG: hypothetical protein LBV04_03435 [Deferribacteraceae bacterium]|jgi:hypothetical protein|nr:hypothetical protein [Deferribacteraceae bacterium]